MILRFKVLGSLVEFWVEFFREVMLEEFYLFGFLLGGEEL